MDKYRIPSDAACELDGCSSPVYSKKLCQFHYNRAWRAAHPPDKERRERQRESDRKARQKNPELYRQRYALWYAKACKDEEFRARKSALAVEWARNNREQFYAIQKRRRAKKRGVDATLTAKEWKDILNAQRGCCFYCGDVAVLEQEHKTPLSRGGAHSADNVVGACVPCNRRKATKTETEFRAILKDRTC